MREYLPLTEPNPDSTSNGTNTTTTNIDSNLLLNDLSARTRQSNSSISSRLDLLRHRLLSIQVEEGIENEFQLNRELYGYFLIIFVIFLLLILNYFPVTDNSTSASESVMFSTYYKGRYRLCTTTASTITSRDSATIGYIEGNADVTLFYKDVNLHGYYRIYALFSLELQSESKWYHQTSTSNGLFTSRKNGGHLIIGLSNLISTNSAITASSTTTASSGPNDPNTTTQGSTEEGTTNTTTANTSTITSRNSATIGSSGEKLYLNSFIPNFINVDNLPSDYLMTATSSPGGEGRRPTGCQGRYKVRKRDRRLLNSIRLNRWNEFAPLSDVYLYNLELTQSNNPFSSTTTTVSGVRTRSYRKLDEFYLLNLRKFVQNEFQHMANFDLSNYNLFSVFSTSNPYSTTGRSGPDDPKTTTNTANSTTTVGSSEEEVWEEEEVVRTSKFSNDILDLYFNPNPYSTTTTTTTSGGSDLTALLTSNETNLSLQFTGDEKDMVKLSTKTYWFSIFFIIKCLLEILIVYRQFNRVESGGQGRTVSLSSLSLLSFQDVLEAFLLLYHGGIFFDNVLNFGLLMIFKFALICIVHQNFIVLVWRANNTRFIRRGWVNTQKAFIHFYKYYFTFIGLLIVIWYFYYSTLPAVIVPTFFCWFPQIFLDVWRGQNNSLDFIFIVLTIVLKLLFPIYAFYFEDNIFSYDKFSSDYIRRNDKLVYLILFISCLQLIFISVQRLYGPRYFGSWAILPKIYSYVRPWSKMMQDDEQECVICMYDIVQSERDWSLTPCDHLFHTKCLEEWTRIKLECPNCRRPIPPINPSNNY